jgi:hypothetical protein
MHRSEVDSLQVFQSSDTMAMLRMVFCILFWTSTVLTLALGQGLVYHDQPVEKWRKTFNAIGEGNGVFLSPPGDMLVAVSRLGIVRAYDPADGGVLWTFSPPLIGGGSISCQSGITFVYTETLAYLAYMVTDTVAGEVSTYVKCGLREPGNP